MCISDEILLDHLHNLWTVETFGRKPSGTELLPPTLYYRGLNTTSGGLYVSRLSDLPSKCKDYCVFVCPGTRPADTQKCRGAAVLCVRNEGEDILSLFNAIQTFYGRVSAWAFRMQELLIRGAEITEYVEASIPIFENGITITDYDLNILVDCAAQEKTGEKVLALEQELNQIPADVFARHAQEFLPSVKDREPYFIKGQRKNPEGNNYCINLFMGDIYVGCCTLYDCMHPMQEPDFRLFRVFADFIRLAISRSSENDLRPVVTMGTVFTALMQSYPVSSEDYRQVMRLLKHNLDMHGQKFGSWYCTVVQSANRGRVLPEKYLCSVMEEMLSYTAAVAYEGKIVLFTVLPETENVQDSVCDILLPFLKDMNFLAAVSAPFTDLYQGRKYYRQAECVLEFGCKSKARDHIFLFQDYALAYLLEHAAGEFSPEIMMTPGLKALREDSASVDYWDTLRQYLWNECNASETARQMFLHRSTLLTRLEKIREWVDLDDPDTRLYLRIMTKMLP